METPDKLKIWTPSWRGVIITVSLGVNIILIRSIVELVNKKEDCQICESLGSECECPAIKQLCLTRTNTSKGCRLCPTSWQLHGNHCYYYSDETHRTWSQSRDHCKEMGADLLVIKDQEQQEFIQETLRQRKDDTYWVGLHHDGQNLIWVDGEHYNNSLFEIKPPSSPSLSSERCVLMTTSGFYQINCNSAYPWICLKKCVII